MTGPRHMPDQVRHRLTDAEMAAVLDTIALGDWDDGVIATFRIFGVDLTDPDCPRVSASAYAIPEDQWGVIAQACGATSTNDIGRVNHMLDWMNYGPSGYAEEAS